MDYLAAARRTRTRAMLFFIPDSGSQQPPAVSDSVWDVDDGGRWKSDNDFPVYAVSGETGAELMEQMVAYLGDVDDVPFGNNIRQEFGPGSVKLYAQFETGMNIFRPFSSLFLSYTSLHVIFCLYSFYIIISCTMALTSLTILGFTAEMPELWIFVLVVLGVVGLIVAGTSAFMHFVQYRRRYLLRRRIASGETDLEIIGISKFTVPQNMLDKLPTYSYKSASSNGCPEKDQNNQNKNSSGQQVKQALIDEKEREASRSFSGSNSSLPMRQKPHASSTPAYSQPTCAICLDDFESNSTIVRELPCTHIFHPSCIDLFLKDISSLCPMCKNSVLPTGYCPARITNAMVRRERLARRSRQRRGRGMGEASEGDNNSRPNSTISSMSVASTISRTEMVAPPSSSHTRSRFSTTMRPLSNRMSQISFPRRSTLSPNNNDTVPEIPNRFQLANTQNISNEAPSTVTPLSQPPPPTDSPNRQAWTRQRARALLRRSTMIGTNGQTANISGARDTAAEDEEDEESQTPRWRRVLTSVFPGFT